MGRNRAARQGCLHRQPRRGFLGQVRPHRRSGAGIRHRGARPARPPSAVGHARLQPARKPVDPDAARGRHRLRRLCRRRRGALPRQGQVLPDLERAQPIRRMGRAATGPRRLPRHAARGRLGRTGRQSRRRHRPGRAGAHDRNRARQHQRPAVPGAALSAGRQGRVRHRLQHVLRAVHRPARSPHRRVPNEPSSRRALARDHGSPRRRRHADLGFGVWLDVAAFRLAGRSGHLGQSPGGGSGGLDRGRHPAGA